MGAAAAPNRNNPWKNSKGVRLDALLFELNGAPGMIRTCDPLIRSQVLYPTELRVPEAVNSKW